MMVKVKGREDLLRQERREEVTEVYLSRRLSKKFAVAILTVFPNVKRIYLPRSLYQLTDRRVVEALQRVGVEVTPTGRSRGRPSKYTEETLKLIVEKYKSGERVPEISRSLGIPLRTVYYILRRMGVHR